MRMVTLYDPATGQVACSTSVHLPLGIDPLTATEAQWAAAIEALSASAGMPCVEGDAEPGQRVIGGQLVDAKPPTLDVLKAAQWTALKRHRDLLEASGFPYLGKTVDSDSRSVQRINTAVQAAQAAMGAGVPFSIVWTCADNSLLTLDGPGMLGMPVALATYADQLHQTCKTLRAQIEAATTPAAVQAVAWPAQISQE